LFFLLYFSKISSQLWLFLISLKTDLIHELWNSLIACAMTVYVENYARCICEIKFRIAMAKAAFSEQKSLFTSKLHLNLRKKLIKCYIWSIALCGGETWTLQKVLLCGAGEGWRRSDGLMV
jgi:hypothetical protein